MKTELFAGKRGVVMGVANDHSLAWAIAQACSSAELVLTYQNDKLARRVKPLAESVGARALPCDVNDAHSVEGFFSTLQESGGLDFLVHAIAFSDRDELSGRYIHTTEANFVQTLLTSCYSFTRVARHAEPLMTSGGSLLTLTYAGSERVVPSYNVMGVAKAALEASVRYLAFDLGEKSLRVNGLSAGPVRTLSSAAIEGGRFIHAWQGAQSPLRRAVTLEDVAGSAVYLLSDLGSGVTGEIHHVDCGYNIMGMALTTPSASSS